MDISMEWHSIFSKYKDYVFVVEGKKDVRALNSLGFERVYAIHQTGVSLLERIEEIANCLGKKDTLCILTDFDKKGKQLYILIKKEMRILGVKLDSSLRKILLINGVSHIEGLGSFLEKYSIDS